MPLVSDGKNSGNSFLLPLPRENFLATAAKRFFRNFYRHLPTASCADVLNVESVTASRQYFQRELNFFTDGMPTVLLMKLPSPCPLWNARAEALNLNIAIIDIKETHGSSD